MGLNRSSLYYQSAPVAPEELALKHAIDEIYTAHPYYGSRRITEHLHKYQKMLVARETVQRPGQAGRRILSAGKKHQGRVAVHAAAFSA